MLRLRSSSTRRGDGVHADVDVVVTTHGAEPDLPATLRSLDRAADSPLRITIVDDGSPTPLRLSRPNVRVIRQECRRGVAASRHEAAIGCQGDVLTFVDAHQRFTPGCLQRCAALALDRRAVVSPTVAGFGLFAQRLYGARFQLCPQQGYFKAEWITRRPSGDISEYTSLKGPGYSIPRELYARLAWSPLLRGWGGSEAWISLKAFFQRIAILYLRGPIAYHRFRRKFPYAVTWDEIWRNQALLARICFEERTWRRHWLPRLFVPRLPAETLAEIESPPVVAEHDAFQSLKQRPDRDFWTHLLQRPVPPEVL